MSKSFRLVFLAAVLWLIGTASSDSRNFSPDAGEIGWTQSKPEGLLQPISAVTNNTISVKLSNIPVGKIIQIGDATNGLKFVKVSDNQYLSITPQCSDPVLATTGAQKLLAYTGNYQEYTFYAGCEYQIELWGASGTSGSVIKPGYGAYTAGDMAFTTNTTMYLYLGQTGSYGQYHGNPVSVPYYQYNGGGSGYSRHNLVIVGDGAGSTDVRLINNEWNNFNSLKSRIMVAAGGTTGLQYSSTCNFNGTNGGGLTGYDGSICKDGSQYNSHPQAQGGGQTYAGYADGKYDTRGYFGKGGITTGHIGSGGSSGYFGGEAGTDHGWGVATGGSGSSFISGHRGCIAIDENSTEEIYKHQGDTSGYVHISGQINFVNDSNGTECTEDSDDIVCSYHYSGYTFTNTVMIDGAGYQWTNVKGTLKQMPNPTGGNYASGVGHTGNGHARITRLN